MSLTEPACFPVETDPDAYRALVERCRAMLARLPAGSAYSHVTAARLHRLPLSFGMAADSRLHVIRPLPHTQVRRPDVVGHRALHHRDIGEVEGLPVVGLTDTWVDLGELIGRGKPVGLDDTIVLGDAVATRLGSIASMQEAVLKRVRPRGKNTLLEGLQLVRVGSGSSMETLSRIMFVRVGLPEPRINVPIWSEKFPGLLLGIGDLVWRLPQPDPLPDLKVVGEYQGVAFHSSPEQRERDRVRRTGFEDDGWQMKYIWAADMTGEAARRATCLGFARMLHVPADALDMSGCAPRFFSQYAMDQAVRRDDRWRHRRGSV